MTDAEWLVCSDPVAIVMLEYPQGPFTGRKLLHFLGASLPTLFQRATCTVCRARMDVFDRVAEQPYSLEAKLQLDEARLAGCRVKPAGCPLHRLYRYVAFYLEGNLLWCELWNYILDLECESNEEAVREFNQARPTLSLDEKKEFRRENGLARAAKLAGAIKCIHDVLGNPFQHLSLKPSWLAWNDSAIPKMAQAIYDARAFDRLPQLADALEAAGCTDAAILSHCRTPGEHVRGCWVVDLLPSRQVVTDPAGPW